MAIVDDADKRARFLLAKGYKGIFVAEIDGTGLQQNTLYIQKADQVIKLPVWEEYRTFRTEKGEIEEGLGLQIISTAAVRQHLHVGIAVSQLSEWFAIDCIPGELIIRKIHYN
jgi:hypothetical protein